MLAGLVAMVATVKPDERVVLFPTAAALDEEAGVWRVPVHGWIFEPETGSVRRRALLASLEEALDLSDDAARSHVFRRRARAFLVDNERGKELRVRVGDAVVEAGASQPNGHFRAVAPLVRREPGWIELAVALSDGDPRRFVGEARLVPPRGVSVISDIDDTIKVSDVRDRAALLRRTFLEGFVAVDGMAGLYDAWRREGAVFHYVSSSPWQLFEPLWAFLHRAGFPRGSAHLKTFRWKDASFFDLFASARETKPPVLEALLATWPERRFVLVGDAGEEDPEIYGELARRNPQQVRLILIRDVGGALDGARRERAFAGLPRDRWIVFADARRLDARALFARAIGE